MGHSLSYTIHIQYAFSPETELKFNERLNITKLQFPFIQVTEKRSLLELNKLQKTNSDLAYLN